MSAEPQLTPNWKLLEGQLLPGGYEIGSCLSAGADSASFAIRILGDRFTKASVEVYAPGQVSADELAAWQELTLLRSTAVSLPLSAGETHLNAAAVVYCVWQTPDENLGSVLSERTLQPDEVQAVTTALLDALAFLHANGFAQGALSPQTVLAFGDSIRLSAAPACKLNSPEISRVVTPIYLAPESKGKNATAAADLYCLGASIFEMLTQQSCSAACREQAEALPAPFSALVTACLEPNAERRCDINRARALLRGERPRSIAPSATAPSAGLTAPLIAPVAASSPATPAARVPAELPKTASTGSASRPPAPTLEPKAAGEPVVQQQSIAQGTAPKTAPDAASTVLPPPVTRRSAAAQSGSKLWLYVGLAVLLVAGLMWFTRPKPQVHALPAAPVPQPVGNPVANNGAPTAGGQTHVVQPATSTTAPNTIAPKTSVSRGGGDAVWRVVAYTFARESDARKRGDAIRAKHPGLDPTIFSPSGTGSPYLVVLGGRMTRADADRLRQKARSLGLPRDTYIQNYNH